MVYITHESYVVSSPGVWKKVQAQYRVFRQIFGQAYYTVYYGHMVYLFDGDKVVDKQPGITKKECYEIIINWIKKYQISKSYIRYELADRWFLNFLERQKELGVKLILEFPTIPYDDGCTSWLLSEDIYCREHLHEYVEYCTTYSDFNEVFGIPCTVLVNGVDIKEHKEKECRSKDGTIVLLAVACFAKWHGYERMIEGMHIYYASGGKKDIIFHLVGNGGQKEYYRRLVEEYQLHDRIIFHGELSGEKLDVLYDNSDIAIGSLGFYKINCENGSPIKLREYCARGIPFIYGYEDISFKQDNYFAYKISNDASPVSVQKIIDFYDNIYNGRNFIHDMRQYALMNLTWDNILRPVISYFTDIKM